MKHLPPFDVIRRSVDLSTTKGHVIAIASYENLIRMIRLLLSTTDVDEGWYLVLHPDVAERIKRGFEPSAQAHCVREGYKEEQLPFAL